MPTTVNITADMSGSSSISMVDTGTRTLLSEMDGGGTLLSTILSGPRPTQNFSPGSSNLTLDVRVYNRNGTRRVFNSNWLDTIEFEITERGGYANGTLQTLIPWEDLQFIGTEYVDIRLWGQFVYRGYLKMPQNEIGVPERASPTLYGLMEFLNGYQVRRCYCYGAEANFATIFQQIIADYVKKANRLPNVIIDNASAAALNITTGSFCAKGKSVSQAFNQLCDAAPNQLIWGCDVDQYGNDRLYLRPRTIDEKYKFSCGEGGNIKSFVSALDTTALYNRVHVIGATLDNTTTLPPNLMPNSSFEDCTTSGEFTTNVLLNPGFDLDNGGTRPGAGWHTQGDPSISGAFARSAPNNAVFDDNPSTPEGIFQDIAVAGIVPVSAAFWGMVPTGEAWTVDFRIQALDIAKNLIAEVFTTINPPADQTYHHYTLEWTNPAAPLTAYVRYVLRTTAGSGANGLNVDDCAMWFPGQTAGDKWAELPAIPPSVNNARMVEADWQNQDIEAYDGSVSGKFYASILATGGYVEVGTPQADAPAVLHGQTYFARMYVYGLQFGLVCELVASLYNSSGNLTHQYGSSQQTLVQGAWNNVSFNFQTTSDTANVAISIRFYSTGIYYVDAAGLYLGILPDEYYPSTNFEAIKSVQDYTSMQIGEDQYNSIVDWGEREPSDITMDTIIDTPTLDAFLIGYFSAFAIPSVQAKLNIYAATYPIFQDGGLKILNLPSPPPNLFPTRIRYQVGESVEIEIDCNNERPDMALLLRQLALETVF